MKKKSLEELHESLNDSICRGNVHSLLDTLSQSNSLNVVNTKFFNIAVESQSKAIVEALLSYFENNQLSRYAEGSLEFLQLKKKIHDILEVSIQDIEIMEDMKEILLPYIDLDSQSDESEQDLSGFDIDQFNTSDEEISYNESPNPYLTEENLNLFGYSDYHDNDLYNTPVIGQH